MKYSYALILLLLFTACQTIKIKNETYKISSATPELGSIGQSKSRSNTKNDFKIRVLPVLENNIRVAIEAVPFNNKLYGIYKKKERFNQKQSKLNYVDSLPSKPELTTIRIIDVLGYIKELNASYNANVLKHLLDTQTSKIVTSIAVSLSDVEIAKMREADTYYLSNLQDSKYMISLYKMGKKTEVIHIIPQTILAYRLSKICWAQNKGQWYIADLNEGNDNCQGNTLKKPTKKEKEESLFDM